MFRRQQRIARTERQTVRPPYDRARHDLNRNLQLAYHGPDHRNLLKILLAEISLIGLHDREQAAHHLRHTVEMARTVRALHHLVGLSEIELPRIGLGIDILDRRGINEVGAGCLEQLQVGFQIARITAQIGRIIKLRGIDEDAHHHPTALAAAAFDQRNVPLVQRAHRRNEAGEYLFITQGGGEFGTPVENLHRIDRFSF